MKNIFLSITLGLGLVGSNSLVADCKQPEQQKSYMSPKARAIVAAGVTAGTFYALKTHPNGEKLIKLLKDNQDYICAAATAGTVTYYALGGENIFNNFKASLGFYLMKWGPASIINTGKMTK